MNTGLPKAACIGGRCFRIRSDFREILDICAALNDPELTDQDRAEVAVKIFYPDWDQITDMAAAVKCMLWFLDGGVDRGDQRPQPKQMDWEQDFPMIIAPINRVAGQDVRALPYMHWWTFIGYYMEIGDCTFSTILDIRRKLRKHKKLEKWEREYYDENRELIDFKSAHLTDDEDEFIRQLMTGGVHDG